MTERRFPDDIRSAARRLQYRAPAAVEDRIRAAVASRTSAAPGVLELLSRWYLPIAASLAALTVASTLALYSIAGGPDDLQTVVGAMQRAEEVTGVE